MDLDELNKQLPPQKKSDCESLIGKEFKRSKYGLSIWTDEITFVGYNRNLINQEMSSIDMYVIGKNSPIHYSIDEIVILNKLPLHWIDEAQLNKKIYEKHK